MSVAEATTSTRRGPKRAGEASGRELIILLTALMASSALAIDLMLPAFPDIRSEFGMAADSSQVGWIITAFFFGLAAGPLLYGPASDRFGRKPLMAAGLTVYVLGSIAAVFAPSFGWIVAARVLWGIGSAGPRALAMAMIRDRYEGDAMARLMSMIMAIFLLVPILAPSLGAGLNAIAPWRIVFWVPALAGVALLVWSRRLPETLAPERRRPLSARSLADAGRAVVASRPTLLFTAAITFLFGVMTTYLSGSELIVEDVYDLRAAFPFVFGGIGVMLAIGSLNNARLVHRIGISVLVRRMAVISIVLATALVVLGMSNGGRPPFWAFVVILGLVLPLAQGLVPNANTAAMMPVPHVAGTASALIATVTTLGGSLLGGLVNARFDGTVRPMAIGMFVYIVIAALLILRATRAIAPLEAVTPSHLE